MKRLSCLLSCVLVVGCGVGPGSVTGTVAGKPVEVRDAIYVTQVSEGQTSALIVLSSAPDICTRLNTNHAPKLGHLLMMKVTRQGPLTDGSYSTASSGNDHSASGVFEAFDASCQPAMQYEDGAIEGAIEVTSHDFQAGLIKGNFTVSVGRQHDQLVGEFTAHACTDAHSQATSTPICD